MSTDMAQVDPLWRTALWQQFGAAIDTLENALVACYYYHFSKRRESKDCSARFCVNSRARSAAARACSR
jgi:hypothetical protein